MPVTILNGLPFITTPARLGNLSNYALFEGDGTLVFIGDATVWNDQQVNISSVRLPAVNAPTWTAYKGSQVLAFSGSQDNSIYFTAQISHKYEEGSDIDFHIHYVPEDNTAGNVRWVFTYSWANKFAVFPAETTTTVIIATPGITDQHTREIIDPIDSTGKNISSLLLCSLTRTGSHGSDTYDAKDIYLVALDFHAKLDTVGSRTEMVK